MRHKPPNISIAFYENIVLISIFNPNYDDIIMTYDDFEELAHAVRQSPYGKK